MNAHAGIIKGAHLGIYGDFLYGLNQTRYGTGPLEVMAGPTIGTALDLLTTTLNGLKAESEGRNTHAWAKVAGIVKGLVPGSNLWYTKAAFDHLILQSIQEQLSPGYIANMRNRTMHEYGQSWWWEPGELAPDRAPDLGNALPKD